MEAQQQTKTAAPARNNGGPAFPLTFETSQPPSDAVPGELYLTQPTTVTMLGISVRDYFAAKAMQSLILNPSSMNGDSWEDITAGAYQMADMMLAAREAA